MLNHHMPLAKRAEVGDLRTAELVSELVEQKVWFAVHEVSGPTAEGSVRHPRMCRVVDELRRRGALD